MAIRANMMWWYISFLAVRGPLPAASAAIPSKTPPSATRLAMSTARKGRADSPEHGGRAPCKEHSANGFHNCGGNNTWFLEMSEAHACMLNSAKEEKYRV